MEKIGQKLEVAVQRNPSAKCTKDFARYLILPLFLILLSNFGMAQSLEESRSIFTQSNAAYQAGNYEESLYLYQSIDADYHNFAYHYNLGNTYYKLDSLGKAILHYERAKRFDPRHEDLQVNLQLANQRIVDKIEALPSLGVKDLWSNVTAMRTLGRWTWLSLLTLFVAFGSFIVVILAKTPQIRRVFILTGLLFFIAYLATYLMARQVVNKDSQDAAIIMAPKLEVKGSPSADGTDVFVLHEGTKVEIRSEQDGWLEIRIANGNVGWVLSEDCEMI